MTSYHRFKHLPRHRPDESVNEITILEDQKRRDTHDPVLHDNLGILVHIQLPEEYLTSIILGKLLHDGGDHAAGSTPLRPAVDHYEALASNRTIECLIGHFGRFA